MLLNYKYVPCCCWWLVSVFLLASSLLRWRRWQLAKYSSWPGHLLWPGWACRRTCKFDRCVGFPCFPKKCLVMRHNLILRPGSTKWQKIFGLSIFRLNLEGESIFHKGLSTLQKKLPKVNFKELKIDINWLMFPEKV